MTVMPFCDDHQLTITNVILSNSGVLAILELEKRFKHVLYVDIDIHHGNQVLLSQ